MELRSKIFAEKWFDDSNIKTLPKAALLHCDSTACCNTIARVPHGFIVPPGHSLTDAGLLPTFLSPAPGRPHPEPRLTKTRPIHASLRTLCTSGSMLFSQRRCRDTSQPPASRSPSEHCYPGFFRETTKELAFQYSSPSR